MAARFTLVVLALWLGVAAAHGQSSAGAAPNASIDPATLPARDVHQGLLVGVNPYTSAEQYRARFGKRTPYDGGILAIEVFFRNDNDLPIRINLKTMQLLAGAPGEARQHLDPLLSEEVADRVMLKPKDPRRPLPIPHLGPPPNMTKIGRSSPGTCARRRWQRTLFLLTPQRMEASTSISTGTMIG